MYTRILDEIGLGSMLLQKAILSMKLASIALISGAIALELLDRLTNLGEIGFNINDGLGGTILLAIGRVALIAHGVEATIAAGYALSKNRNAIADGIYTFFVGTVGLWEILDRTESPLPRK